MWCSKATHTIELKKRHRHSGYVEIPLVELFPSNILWKYRILQGQVASRGTPTAWMVKVFGFLVLVCVHQIRCFQMLLNSLDSTSCEVNLIQRIRFDLLEAMVMDMNEKAYHGKSVNYLSFYNFGWCSFLYFEYDFYVAFISCYLNVILLNNHSVSHLPDVSCRHDTQVILWDKRRWPGWRKARESVHCRVHLWLFESSLLRLCGEDRKWHGCAQSEPVTSCKWRFS